MVTPSDHQGSRPARDGSYPSPTSRLLPAAFEDPEHKSTDLEVLKAAIRARLERLIQLDGARADFAEKFEALIQSYDAGSRRRRGVVRGAGEAHSQPEQRAAAARPLGENMTEEELVIFPTSSPSPTRELTAEERAEVKKVARALLNRLKHVVGAELATEGGGAL